MATNVVTYISNLGKSVAYAAQDKVKDMTPAFAEFSSTNAELFKDVYDSVRDYRVTYHKTKQIFKNSKIYEAADVGFKAALEDIKTGQLYNQARKNALADRAIGMDDFNFDFDDSFSDSGFDDFSDFEDDLNFDDESSSSSSISNGDRRIVDSINTSNNAVANAVSLAIGKTGEYLGDAHKTSTRLLYTQNIELGNIFSSGLGTVNQNIGSLIDFSNNVITKHVENSAKFYADNINLMMEQKELLNKLIQINTPKEESNNNSSNSRLTFDDITIGGIPDLKAYMKAIKQNFDSMTSLYDSVMSMGGETGNPLLELVNSPLEFIPKALVNTVIPKTIEKSMGDLNKSFENLFGSLITKFNTMAKDEDNFINQAIGKMLGVNTSISSVSTSDYKKDKVDWDGKSRKALIEVIPGYLSKIVSLLSGEPEKLYDYDNGRFVKSSEIKDILDNRNKSHVKMATADAQQYFNKYMKSMTFDSEDDKKQLEDAIESIFTKMYESGTLFKVNNKDELAYSNYGVNEKDYEIFRTMFGNMPKYIQHSINTSILNERVRHKKENEEFSAKGDSLIQYILNGFELDEFSKNNSSKSRGGLINNNISTAKDNLGHNIFYYMQNMYKELMAIRMNGMLGGNISLNNNQPINPVNPNDLHIEMDSDLYRRLNNEENNRLNRRESFERNEQSRRDTRIQNGNSELINYDDDDVVNKLRNSIKTTNLTEDMEEEQENPGMIQKLLKAKNLSEKTKVFAEKVEELYDKPVSFFNGLIQKADQRMYELIYGREEGGEDVKGFLDSMIYELKGTFYRFNNFLDEKILTPLSEKFKFDEMKEKMKNFLYDKLKIGEMKDKAKKYFLGDKETGESGLLTSTIDRIKSDTKSTFNTIKSDTKDVYSPVIAVAKATKEKYEETKANEPGSAGDNQISRVSKDSVEYKKKHKEVLKLNNKVKGLARTNADLKNRIDDIDSWISSNSDKKETKEYKDKINERVNLINAIKNNEKAIDAASKKIEKLKQFIGNINILKYTPISFTTKASNAVNNLRNNASNDSSSSIPTTDTSSNTQTNTNQNTSNSESSNPVENAVNRATSNTQERTTSNTDNNTVKPLSVMLSEKLDSINSGINKLVEIFNNAKNSNNSRGLNISDVAEGEIPLGSSAEEHGARKKLSTNLANVILNYLTSNTREYAEGGRVEETTVATVSEGEVVLNQDTRSRLGELSDLLDRALGNNTSGVAQETINKAAETINDGISDMKKDFTRVRESLFGNGKDEDRKFEEATKDVFANIKEYAPGMISHSLIGAGLSLVTGMVGGPLVGAAIGAGTGLIKDSDKVKKWLFGEMQDGERQGGVFSKKVLQVAKKYLPDMKKYGIAGGVTSLLLPGIGPLTGIMLGSALGFAKNNEGIQDTLFGDRDGLFSEETKQKLLKNLPRAVAGAGLGLLAGPFGLAGNLILGSAAGFATGTDTFKEAIFGVPDENGEYDNGLLPAMKDAVLNPIKDAFTGFKEDVVEKIKTTMIEPLKSAVDPIKKEISLIFTSIKDKIGDTMDNLFEKSFGVPFRGFLRDRVFKPIGRSIIGVTKKVTNAGLGIASLPFRAVGRYGNHLRGKHVRSGNADYMSAEERLQFREDNPLRMAFRNDKYEETDSILADMSKEDLDKLKNNLSSLEDTYSDAKKIRKNTASNIANKVDKYAGNKVAKKVMSMVRSGRYDRVYPIIEREFKAGRIGRNQYDELVKFLDDNKESMQNSMDNFENKKEVRSNAFNELRKLGFKDISEKNAKKYMKLIGGELDKRNLDEAKDEESSESPNEAQAQAQENHNEIVALLERTIEILSGSRDIQQQSLEEQIAPSQIVDIDDDGGIRSFIRNNDKVNTEDIADNDYEMDMHDDETRKSEREEAREENEVREAINRITGNDNNEDEDGEKKEKKPSLFSKLLDMAMSTTVGKFIIGGIGAFVAQKVLEQFGSSLPEFLGKIFGFIKDAGAKALGFGEGDNDTLEEHTLKWAGENIARGHVTNVGKAMVKKGAKSKGLFKKLGLVTSGAGIDTVSKLGAKTTSLYDKMDGGLRKGINKITGKIQDRAAMNPNGISAKIANKIGDTNIGAKVVDTVKAGPKGFLNGVGKKLGSLIGNQKMAEMGVGGMMKDALGSNQFIQTAVEQFNSFIKKIFTNPVVKSFLGDEKCLAMITKFAPKVAQTMMEQGAKQTPEMLAKIVGGSATGGIVNAAFAVYDFISGFRDAKNILSVTEEPTLGMKVGAGLLKAINGLFIITSLIPERLWVDLIMWIPELFGEKDMKLQKMRQQAKTDAKNYAKKTGKGSMSVAEYNKIQKDGEKKVNKKKGLLDRLKEGAGNFGAKVKEVASNAFNSVVGAVTGVFDWLTGNNKKKTASAPTAKSLPTATPVTTGFGEPHNPNPDPRPKASKMSKPQFRRPVANKTNISKPKKNKKERPLSTKEIKKINDKAVNTPKHWTEIFTGQAGKIHPHSEVPEVRNNFPYYYQFDELWNKQSINGYTIARGGCGPSSVAMILSGILGQKITPMDTGRVAMDGGTWIKGQGAAYTMYKQLGNHYGVDVNEIGSFDEFMQMTNSNMPIAISGKGSRPFTSGGHIIAFVGKDANGNLMINDPGHLYDKTVFTPEEIKRAGYKRAWAFGPPGSLGNVQMPTGDGTTEGAEEPAKPSISNFFSDLGNAMVGTADALFGFDSVANASTASASALAATPTDSSQDPNAVAYGENTPVANQKTDKEKGPNKDSIIYTGKDKDKNKGSNSKNPFDLGITLGKGGPIDEPIIKSFDINGKSTEFIKSDAKPKRLLPSMVKKLKLGMGGPTDDYTDPRLGRGAGDTPGSTAPNVARKTVKSASEAPPTSGPAAQSGNIEGSRVKAFFTAYYPANNKMEGGFNDALGNKLNPRQNTCAAPKDVPFHSAVQVLGTNTLNDGKVFEVTDRGGAINVENGKYHFDLLYPDKTSANKWGTRDGEAIISKNAGFTSPINGAGSTGETSSADSGAPSMSNFFSDLGNAMVGTADALFGFDQVASSTPASSDILTTPPTDSSQDPNAVAYGENTPVANQTTNKEKGPNKDSIIYTGKDKDKGSNSKNPFDLGINLGKGDSGDSAGLGGYTERPTVEQLMNQPLNTWQAITEEELSGWLASKRKGNKPYRPEDAKLFMQASQNAQLDPRYLVAHSAEETGWGTSKICRTKFNFYGINAQDHDPANLAYTYTNIEDGVTGGGKWIADNYTTKGQETLYKMVHDSGGHNYATNPSWARNIATIMSTAPYGGQWIQGGTPTGTSGTTTGTEAEQSSPSISNFFSDLGNAMVGAADALFGFDKIAPETTGESAEGALAGEDGGNGIAYGTDHIADTWFTKKLPARKSSPYGMRNHPKTGKRKKHTGIDYAASMGTSIPSPLTGVVHANMASNQSGGFGNMVVLKDKNGYGHFFAHMQNRSHLKEGQKVGFGQSVGKVGSTGISTGPHLHYEVRKPGLSKGQDMDPNKYMKTYYPKSMDPANKDKVTASPYTPTGSINGINSPTPTNDPSYEPPKANWSGSINGISTAGAHGGKGGPEDSVDINKNIRKRVSNSKAEILQRQREIYNELNNIKKGPKNNENLGQGGADSSFAHKPTRTRIENQKEFDVGTPYSSNKVPLSSYKSYNNDKLLQVIIEILYKIANNTSSLSEIVSLLSKNLNLNISKDDAQKIKDNHDNRNLSYDEARKKLNSNPDPSNQMIMDILNQLATE